MKVYKITLNNGRQFRTLIENKNQEKRFQKLIWDLEEQGLEPIIDYDYCNGISSLKTTESLLDKGLFREKYKRWL